MLSSEAKFVLLNKKCHNEFPGRSKTLALKNTSKIIKFFYQISALLDFSNKLKRKSMTKDSLSSSYFDFL